MLECKEFYIPWRRQKYGQKISTNINHDTRTMKICSIQITIVVDSVNRVVISDGLDSIEAQLFVKLDSGMVVRNHMQIERPTRWVALDQVAAFLDQRCGDAQIAIR